jgi:hypothetical protein
MFPAASRISGSRLISWRAPRCCRQAGSLQLGGFALKFAHRQVQRPGPRHFARDPLGRFELPDEPRANAVP